MLKVLPIRLVGYTVNCWVNKYGKKENCNCTLRCFTFGWVGAMIMNYFDYIQGDYEVHIVTQDYVSDEYVSLFKNRGYILHLVPSKKME